MVCDGDIISARTQPELRLCSVSPNRAQRLSHFKAPGLHTALASPSALASQNSGLQAIRPLCATVHNAIKLPCESQRQQEAPARSAPE